MLQARQIAGLVAAWALFQGASATVDEKSFGGRDVIEVDVAVIGGGASGAHAAVRLKQDYHKSVVLIEKQKMLGGHVDTYYDPVTGSSFEYGIQNYIEYGNATAFCNRFLPTATPERAGLTTRYVDFKTGKELTDYVSPASADVSQALKNYVAMAAKYEDIMLPGYWNWPKGKDIPEDLLMPFGELAQKYDFTAALPRMFEVTAMGSHHYVNETALWVMQAFGAPLARTFLGQATSFVPANGVGNQALYEAIADYLGDDVLFQSTVVDSERRHDGVKLVVQTKRGKKLIKAKRLLSAIQPTLENFTPLDLEPKEKELFDKFSYTRIHAGVVVHPDLPVNQSLDNTPADSEPTNYFSYPEWPFIARFDYFGKNSNLFRILAIGDKDLDKCTVQKLVKKNFRTIARAGTISDDEISKKLVFKALEDHGAMHMRVSNEELKKDFLTKLYALQGNRSTFFTGGGFSVQFTTALWAFNDILLPKLVAGMH